MIRFLRGFKRNEGPWAYFRKPWVKGHAGSLGGIRARRIDRPRSWRQLGFDAQFCSCSYQPY